MDPAEVLTWRARDEEADRQAEAAAAAGEASRGEEFVAGGSGGAADPAAAGAAVGGAARGEDGGRGEEYEIRQVVDARTEEGERLVLTDMRRYADLVGGHERFAEAHRHALRIRAQDTREAALVAIELCKAVCGAIRG